MCLELPDPSRGKEQGLDHRREVGSQLKAAGQGQYPSAQSHNAPRSVTQVMAKPA